MDIWGWVTQNAYAVCVWLFGEAGRVYLAGAVGGAYRAMMAEKRRWRDGVLSVAAGVTSATYLAPVVMALLDHAGLDIGSRPGMETSAGFLAGLTGMSLAKLAIAIIEGRAAKLGGQAE